MEIEEEKVELNSDDGNWEQYADMEVTTPLDVLSSPSSWVWRYVKVGVVCVIILAAVIFCCVRCVWTLVRESFYILFFSWRLRRYRQADKDIDYVKLCEDFRLHKLGRAPSYKQFVLMKKSRKKSTAQQFHSDNETE